MHYASSVCYKLSVCDSKKQSLIVSRRAFRRLHQPSKLILSTEKFLFTRLGCYFTSIPSTSLEGKHRQSPPILNFNICRFNYRGYCDDEILCFDSFTLCWFHWDIWVNTHQSKRNVQRVPGSPFSRPVTVRTLDFPLLLRTHDNYRFT